MPHERAEVERQLQHAQARLQDWAKQLESQGVAADGFRRDPKYRSLRADCRQLEGRLRSIGELEKIEAARAERKTAGTAE